MIFKPLSKIAKIYISSIDKKTKLNESIISLCNFTDVYYNWAITKNNINGFMKASANDIQIEKFTLNKGYVAITKDSETRDDIGISCYIADNLKNTLLGYHCALIIPDKTILNGKYLNAYLHTKTARTYFSNQASGSGQRYTLTIGGIGDVKVPIISLQKQEKIGKFFSFIDSKIENNNKIIAELESMAKTIYNYWFLQFDFPDEKGKPYKSSGGKMVYNEELKREIPKGWSVKGVLELATWKGNSQPPKSSFIYKHKEGYIRFIQNRDYSGYTINTYIPQNHSYETCDVYDIMMDKYGDAGKTRYGLAGAYNVALAKIVPNDEKFREYLRAFLSSESTYNYLNSSSMASTRASLNENNVSYLSIVIPDDFILQKFTKMAFLNIQKILESKRENQELASLRDFLLPMLMNGQVTFKS